MSKLLLHETYFFLENIRKSRIVDETSLKNDLTKFLEWQKSESLKEFWWDFLTRLLEQTALRGLNSPASFWLLSFSFVNIDNKWANCSYLMIWQNFIFFVWSFHDLPIGGAISSPIVYRGRRFHWFFGTTWLARPSLYNIDTFSLTSFGLYGKNRSLWPLITILNQCQVL